MAGIDNSGSSCGSPNLGGWVKYCAYWESHYGWNDCAKAYMSQLEWYDSVLRADSYVIGATVFAIEIGGWADYDLSFDDADQLLTSYLHSQSSV